MVQNEKHTYLVVLFLPHACIIPEILYSNVAECDVDWVHWTIIYKLAFRCHLKEQHIDILSGTDKQIMPRSEKKELICKVVGGSTSVFQRNDPEMAAENGLST